MTKHFRIVFGFLIFGITAHGATGSAPNKGVTFYQDMSTTTVPATFGAGSQLLSGLSNSQSFEICQTSSTPLAGCSYGTSANCVGCTANFIVPPTGCTGFNRDQISIGARICVKGLPPATSVSTGVIFGSAR